jgi:acyl carrier protein
MSPAAREAWLRALLTRISGNSADETGVEADLQEAIGLDSLGRLEVLAAIEDEFDFFFEDNDLLRATTLARMLEAIDGKLSEAAETAG